MNNINLSRVDRKSHTASVNGVYCAI